MKANHGLNETTLTSKIKAEDPVELPMDDLFFDKLHDKIMASVETVEVKPTSKWTKTWVFLEHKSRYYRPANNRTTLQVVKMGLVGVTLTLGLSLGVTSLKLLNLSSESQVASNKQVIIQQALENPQDWMEMAAAVQNDSDFYAEVMNERLNSNQTSDIRL